MAEKKIEGQLILDSQVAPLQIYSDSNSAAAIRLYPSGGRDDTNSIYYIDVADSQVSSPVNINFPASSGTLALTSDIPAPITNYVTTDTTQTITGNKTFSGSVNASSLYGGYVDITVSDASNLTFSLDQSEENFPFMYANAAVYSADFTLDVLTANRSYVIPDKSGTFALTSDFSASTTGSATTEAKYITINGTEWKLGSGSGLYLPLTGGTLSGDLYTTNRIYMKAPNTSSDAPAICFLRGTYGSDANTDWLISEDTYDNLLIESYKNGAVNVKVKIDNSDFNVYNDIVARNKGIYVFDSNNNYKVSLGTDGVTYSSGGFTSSGVFKIYPTSNNQLDFYSTTGDGGMWFSYGMPVGGNAVNKFHFGNGSGGHGDIYCNTLYTKEIYGTGTWVSAGYLFYGTNIAPNWNNQLDIGGSGLSWHYIYANGGSWTSDRRLKENIKDTNLKALPLINQLSIRDYNWKDGQKEQSIGLIAQELREVVPEKYETIFIRGAETEKEYLSIDSGALVMLSLKAIQEQQSKIKELEDRIKELEK